MKKILYIFVFAALTTAAVSCKQAVYAEASGQEITFVATQEREDNAETDTRTVLGDNGAVLWSPKDVISIFKGSGSGGGSKFTSQNSEPAATVEFKGYLEGLGALQSGQYYWAVYPYSTSNSCDGKGITATLPAYQTAVKGSFGKDCHPAMARSTVTGLSFYAIAGGLEFTLTRSDIKSISIKGNNNEALAGTYKATFGSDGKPAVQVTSSIKEITLTAPDGSTFIPGETYVISLLPATLSKGVTITLITEGNKQGIISSTKSQTVKRAVLGRIKGIDGKVNNWTDIPGTTAAKLSGITYQLNVYTFADSDGDGWGDIKGITQHLDYLDGLGATALWLSPIQTSASYHGYDILDYYTVNPRLGTEADLKDLIVKAKAKDIDIYLDYVLNHSGLGDWFYSAISSTDSPYRSYYVLSDNPSADAAAGKIDNFGGGKDNGGMGSWHAAAGGALGYTGLLHFKLDASVSSAPTLTVTTTAESAQAGNTDTSVK